MQDFSRNRNPANIQKAKEFLKSLVAVAEKNELDQSVVLEHGGYKYILKPQEDLLIVANSKKEKTHVKLENFENIASQFNAIEMEHLLTQAEKFVADIDTLKIENLQEFLESCVYYEACQEGDIIVDKETGDKYRKSIDRNETEAVRDEILQKQQEKDAVEPMPETNKRELASNIEKEPDLDEKIKNNTNLDTNAKEEVQPQEIDNSTR